MPHRNFGTLLQFLLAPPKASHATLLTRSPRAHTQIYYPPSIPCSPPCNLPSPSGLGQVLGGNCIGRAGLCVSAIQVVDTLYGIDETCYCLKRQSALSQILCIQCSFTIRNPYRHWSLDGKPVAPATHLPSGTHSFTRSYL